MSCYEVLLSVIYTGKAMIWALLKEKIFESALLCFGKVKTGDLASDLDFPLCHLIPVVCYGAVIKKWQEITTG